MEYPGKHEPLVGPELFDRVQRILDDRDQHRVKLRRHQHYLRGLMTCARCRSRLLFMVTRGQAGGHFAYYACSRRHRGDGCDLPYLPAHELEQRLERHWPRYVRLDRIDAEAVGQRLHDQLTNDQHGQQDTIRQLTTRLARLDKQRLKLIEMAYADAIPLDLLKREQARIARETLQLQHQLDEAQHSNHQTYDLYQQAQGLMRRGAEIYASATPEVRRQLNRAFLARLEIDVDNEHVTLGSPWAEINQAAVHLRQQQATSHPHEPNLPKIDRPGPSGQ